jgi:hypothetical protein
VELVTFPTRGRIRVLQQTAKLLCKYDVCWTAEQFAETVGFRCHPLKGRQIFQRLAASLKRCPDTNPCPSAYGTGEGRTFSASCFRRGLSKLIHATPVQAMLAQAALPPVTVV